MPDDERVRACHHRPRRIAIIQTNNIAVIISRAPIPNGPSALPCREFPSLIPKAFCTVNMTASKKFEASQSSHARKFSNAPVIR